LVDVVKVINSAGYKIPRRMNNKQRILIGIAVCLLILTGLFPPWRTISSKGNRPGPYSRLWEPPSDNFEIDTTRLGIEWILIALVSGALLGLFRKKHRESEPEKQLQDQLGKLKKENHQLTTQLSEARSRYVQARQTLIDKYEVEQSQLKDIFGY
jgi:hypothetical protein